MKMGVEVAMTKMVEEELMVLVPIAICPLLFTVSNAPPVLVATTRSGAV